MAKLSCLCLAMLVLLCLLYATVAQNEDVGYDNGVGGNDVGSDDAGYDVGSDDAGYDVGYDDYGSDVEHDISQPAKRRGGGRPPRPPRPNPNRPNRPKPRPKICVYYHGKRVCYRP